MSFIVLRVAHSASRRLWYGSVIVWEAGWERNRTLPCVTAAHADVTGVSRLDDVMEGLHLNQLRQNLYFAAVGPENETHSFLNRGVRIEPTTWGVTTNIRHPRRRNHTYGTAKRRCNRRPVFSSCSSPTRRCTRIGSAPGV